MFGMGFGLAILMLSLGLGYIICVKADKEKGFLKTVGYVIGIILMVASVYLVIDSVASMANMRKMMRPGAGGAMQQQRRQPVVMPRPAASEAMPQQPAEAAPVTQGTQK